MIISRGTAIGMLVQRIRRLGEITAEKAAEKSVPVIKKLANEAYQTTVSPENEPFAPLKTPKYTKSKNKGFDFAVSMKNGKYLQKPIIGLKPTTTVQIGSHKGMVTGGNQKWYWRFHHTGTKKMTHRRIFPASAQNTSIRWKNSVAEAIQKEIIRLLKKGEW